MESDFMMMRSDFIGRWAAQVVREKREVEYVTWLARAGRLLGDHLPSYAMTGGWADAERIGMAVAVGLVSEAWQPPQGFSGAVLCSIRASDRGHAASALRALIAASPLGEALGWVPSIVEEQAGLSARGKKK